MTKRNCIRCLIKFGLMLALSPVQATLGDGSEHDNHLRALMKKHLRITNGHVQWPSEVRTALIYWNTFNEAA